MIGGGRWSKQDKILHGAYINFVSKTNKVGANKHGGSTPDTGLPSLSAPIVTLDGETLNIIATDENTKSFVIFVDGKEMATVKVVEDISLISFTISGTTYQAESGMTWGEWVESEYNTVGASVEPDGTIYAPIDSYGSVRLNEVNVYDTDLIIAEASYSIKHFSGGGIN